MADLDDRGPLSRRSRGKYGKRRSSCQTGQVHSHHDLKDCQGNGNMGSLDDSDLLLAQINFEDDLEEDPLRDRKRPNCHTSNQTFISDDRKKNSHRWSSDDMILAHKNESHCKFEKESKPFQETLGNVSPINGNISELSKESSCVYFLDDDKDLFDDDDFAFFPESTQETLNRKKSDSNMKNEDKESCIENYKEQSKNNELYAANNVNSDNTGEKERPSLKPTSLKDRLKLRLKQNAGVVTVRQNFEQVAKDEALLKARIEASQIRKEGDKNDIGPFFGLPAKVKQLYENARGIKQLYDWQNECLQLPAVRKRQNLIYTLPTSGGKTLVAEILIMRELLCHQKDALLILPFVSIVQEKVQTISEFAAELDFLVEEYAGGKGRFPPIKRQKKKSLYIATIEKGHSLINSLIDTERISALGLVIVDELHMIGEGGSRGATLESTLLKLLALKGNVQIVGMSATLSNLQDLQMFLKAEVYKNDFRPVSLQEYVKVEDNVFSVNNNALTVDEKLEHCKTVLFPYTSDVLKQDPDHLLGLVLEVIPNNSCLVFCPTKKNCENVAMMLSRLMCNHHRHLTTVKKAKRKELLGELLQNGNGKICPVLEYTVHFGIAYHHSGLTGDERKVIEEAYANGVLCLLACTSTLAAGVNLPAKRVILRSPYVGSSFIEYSQYKQMTGRAGRAGIDSSGESILVVKKEDRMKVKDLLSGPKDYCHSSLGHDDGKGIRSLLLSCIGLKLITDTESAFDLMKGSLLHIQGEKLEVDMETMTKECLQCLLDWDLITQSKDKSGDSKGSHCLQVTALGKATFKGSVDHTHSSQLYNDLKLAEESLNLSTHLHLLYLVTPYDAAQTVSPDWNIYLNQFCKLSEKEVKAATVIGVPESFVNLKASGRQPRKKVNELIVKRFYLTLILWNLWNQRSIWDVADKFCLPRGYVQNLMSQSAAFASCAFHFCQELEEFWAYQDLMQNFVKRLGFCVTVELIPLMEIPGVKLARAKQLLAAGYKTVSQLSFADPSTLSSNIQHLSLRMAKQLICSAKNVLEEKAAALLEEVETLINVPNTIEDDKDLFEDVS